MKIKELFEAGNMPFEMEALEAAINEHAHEMNYDDFEHDDGVCTAAVSWQYGCGDIRLSVEDNKLRLQMRLEAQNGEEDDADITMPISNYELVASEIDEFLGTRSHNLQDSDED